MNGGDRVDFWIGITILAGIIVGLIVGLFAARKNRSGSKWLLACYVSILSSIFIKVYLGFGFGLLDGIIFWLIIWLTIMAFMPFLCPKCHNSITNKQRRMNECPHCHILDNKKVKECIVCGENYPNNLSNCPKCGKSGWQRPVGQASNAIKETKAEKKETRDEVVVAEKVEVTPGEENTKELVEDLGSSDSEKRKSAAKALGEKGAKARAAVCALAVALKDKDSEVGVLAAMALGEIGEMAKAAIPELLEAMESGKGEVRKCAASVLCRIAPEAKGMVEALGRMKPKTDRTKKADCGAAQSQD